MSDQNRTSSVTAKQPRGVPRCRSHTTTYYFLERQRAKGEGLIMRRILRPWRWVLGIFVVMVAFVSCQTGTRVGTSTVKAVWVPDRGDGTYRNPVIFADYSDPDVVRVGDDFYLVSSSFNCVPALLILHSKDLVNWTIIGHVFDKFPYGQFDLPQHGDGVWAPSIRYHKGLFYVYYGDPDYGIFMARARNPAGRGARWCACRRRRDGLIPVRFGMRTGRRTSCMRGPRAARGSTASSPSIA